jgi:hypothetical protein
MYAPQDLIQDYFGTERVWTLLEQRYPQFFKREIIEDVKIEYVEVDGKLLEMRTSEQTIRYKTVGQVYYYMNDSHYYLSDVEFKYRGL